ncbi:GAF domain-containing protein [Arthrobacter monumenti]
MANDLPLDELSVVFARIRGLLLTEETVNDAVAVLAGAAKESIPNTLGAGITLIDAAGAKTSTGSTDGIVRRLDEAQYEIGEGPCLTAREAMRTIRIDDTLTDERWPRWTSAVADLPVRSTLSTPLLHAGAAIGAIKLYSSIPGAFTDETQRLLEMFAVPAAALLGNVQTDELPKRLSDDLRTSLQTRDTVAVAKGILMERHGMTEDEATAFLISTSRSSGNTLHAGAQDLVAEASALDG